MKKTVFLLTGILLLALMAGSCSKKEYDTYAGLYGIVSEAATADPVGGVSVILSPGGRTQVTGTDGRFEFNDLDPQQYTITVQKTGYQTNRKTVTAITGEKIEANIPLTKSN